MGTTRFTYNSSLAHLREEEIRIAREKEEKNLIVKKDMTKEEKQEIKGAAKKLKEEMKQKKDEIKEEKEKLRDTSKQQKDYLKKQLKYLKDTFQKQKDHLKEKIKNADKQEKKHLKIVLDEIKETECREKEKLENGLDEIKENEMDRKIELKTEYLELTSLEIAKNKIRDKFVTEKDNPWFEDKPWLSETPKDIRAGAVQDLFAARNVAFINKERGNITKFRLSFRKKGADKSIRIPKSAIKIQAKETKNVKKPRYNISIYPTYMSPIKCCRNDKALKSLIVTTDCRLGCDRNKWYLYVPITLEKDDHLPLNESAGLDPGIRKIFTVYGENKVEVFKLNKPKLKETQRRLDRFQSFKDRKKIPKRSYTKRIKKIYTQLDNYIDDLHYKIITDLTKSYKSIFLPNFKSQEIVKKMKGRTNRRNLFAIKHYLLRKRFIEKTQRMTHSQVYICTEEYTTQQCPICTKLTKIGWSEIYQCKTCGFTCDRDYNSGRNIFIKLFTENKC